MIFTTKEQKAIERAKKAWNYYTNDFVTDYAAKAVQLPIGRTIENTLVYDNWINKTVNRYASSAIGKYASVEVEDENLQNLLTEWHESIDFEAKMTSIARYQGLYGYAVVKLIFKLDRDEYGNVIVAGKKEEDILAGFDIAVFGANNSVVRYDEYGNIDCIIVMVGNRLEAFYSDRIEVYEKKNFARYELVRIDPNPIYPAPLAFVVKNLETGNETMSDVQNIIGLQEALNDALTSSRLNAHYHGFPTYTATGVEITYVKDDEGNDTHIPQPLVMGAGMTLQSENSEAKFNRLDAADATQTIATIESLTKEIAVATNSLSLLTGQIPSGTALSYMLTDFNSAVVEKQTKLKGFMTRLHRSVFKLLDYVLNTKYQDAKLKVFVAGHNPIQKQMEYQQAKELYALSAISLETLLDSSEVVENTADEVAKLQGEKALAGATESPMTAFLR